MKAGVPIQLTLYLLFTLALPETTCSLGSEVGHGRRVAGMLGMPQENTRRPCLVKHGHDALIKIIAVIVCIEDNIPQHG